MHCRSFGYNFLADVLTTESSFLYMKNKAYKAVNTLLIRRKKFRRRYDLLSPLANCSKIVSLLALTATSSTHFCRVINPTNKIFFIFSGTNDNTHGS
jgi:hypothetical protein